MLGHGQSGGGYDERGGGGDVERVATVATGAHDVDGRIVREVDGMAHLQEGVAEAAKLVHGDGAHEENGDEGRRLGVVVAPLCDVLQDGARLVAAEAAVLGELVEDIFHKDE